MLIDYDPAKRAETLAKRGLDMQDAALIFAGPVITLEDTRQDYGEPRLITVGFLHDRMVFIAWTPRDETRRIISMRKANDREIARYGPALTFGAG